jgi:glycerol kinase
MTWLRENLTAGGVVTTTDTWLLARLGGGYVTDAATASRTLLLDLDAADWSAEACGIFGVDPGALPEVADCAAVTGETSAFGKAVPVAGLAVDQQAALLAERCFAAGQAKCTYGTGAFLLATTGTTAVRSASGLSASVAWRLAGTPTYCLDGQVYTAGAAVRWLVETGLLRDAGELDEAGGSVPDSGGVTFLPSLAGLGAPHWRPAARGAFLGLSLSTTRAHLIRAVTDGLAASVALLASSVAADLSGPLTVLRADGGLTRSRLLMQTQADLLQLPVEVCRTPDATALGAAALARMGMGEAGGLDQAVGPADVEAVIEPRISAGEAARRLAGFEAALRASLAASR